MAGLSQRFIKEGFTLPKYMLYAGNKSLFNLAISSFSAYFKDTKFLFIARELYDTKQFIKEECQLMGIDNFEVVILHKPTQGQAETVYLGLKNSTIDSETPISIFNIDTFRPGFKFPSQIGFWDGYLEVFKGDGANWSYAKTESENSTKVLETAEKVEISNNCSTGLYYFKSANLFYQAFENRNPIDSTSKIKELYVAPLYNRLIQVGKEIHINIINRDEVLFCGVPSEYYDYLKKEVTKY